MCINSSWEEIYGFRNIDEYHRFVEYIERQVTEGDAIEIESDEHYGRGEIYGGRWFKAADSGVIWRLIPPDPPFRGLWEAVIK